MYCTIPDDHPNTELHEAAADISLLEAIGLVYAASLLGTNYVLSDNTARIFVDCVLSHNRLRNAFTENGSLYSMTMAATGFLETYDELQLTFEV